MKRYLGRWRWLGLLGVLALTFGLITVACDDDDNSDAEPTTAAETPAQTPDETAPPGAATFEVRAGDAEGVVTVLEFLPEDVTIREGDTVRWQFPSPEIHTVSFMGGQEVPAVIVPIDAGPAAQINPAAAFAAGDPTAFDGAGLLNSGILPSEEPPATSFDTTFTSAGTFEYICIIHPDMTGTVTVVAADDEVPAQSVIDAQADGQFQEHIAEGQAAADALVATSTDNADGSKSWTMPMGVTTEHTDVLAFLPSLLEIGVGDTVTWTNDSLAPHTATFTSDGEYPEFLLPQPQEAGPPILAINPEVAGAVPATEPPVPYDGTGYVNSGVLGPAPEFQAKIWTAQFTTAGQFNYVCIIHLPNGMVGSVNVTE